MNRTDEPEDVASDLRQEHLRAPFPAGLAGAERANIDLVLLDADIAGCVSGWRHNNGALDGERQIILHRSLADLDRILSLLDPTDDPPYWRRLRRLAHLVSEAHTGPVT